MSNGIGSLEWAQRTGGKLSIKNKFEMLGVMIRVQIQDVLRLLSANPREQLSRLDLSAVVIPDSDLAKRAFELTESVSSPALLNHSQRTFFWASVLAQLDDVKLDPEFLYVASTLHDLGLTDTYNQHDQTAKCFAVEGARVAADFIGDTQLANDEFSDRLNEAITLHLNLNIPHDMPEEHYMAAGTTFDVIGQGYKDVSRTVVDTVLQQYPRLDFKADLLQRFKREYKNRPNSRISFYARYGGLNARIKSAPFDE